MRWANWVNVGHENLLFSTTKRSILRQVLIHSPICQTSHAALHWGMRVNLYILGAHLKIYRLENRTGFL